MTHPRVAVLILAHRGVQNPSIWTDWASCETEYPIKLVAICGDSNDDVCQRHGIQGIEILPTQWCGKDIPTNTLRGFKYVAERYPHIEIVYLVSGYCLPAQWPSFLYRKASPLPRAHVDHPSTWDPMQSSVVILSAKRQVVTEGVQWISLTRETIICLRDDPALLSFLDKRKLKDFSCPDETYIQTLVLRAKVPYQDIAYMDQNRATNSSPSPIEWGMESKRRRIVWDDTSYRTYTTKQAIWFAHKAGYAFVRKFKPLPGLTSFKMLLEYAQPTGKQVQIPLGTQNT